MTILCLKPPTVGNPGRQHRHLRLFVVDHDDSW